MKTIFDLIKPDTDERVDQTRRKVTKAVWVTPVVTTIIIPDHAQASGPPPTTPEPPPTTPTPYVPPTFSVAAQASCVKEKSSQPECAFVDITDPDAVKFSFGIDVTVNPDGDGETDFPITIDWALSSGDGGDTPNGVFSGTTSGGSFSESGTSTLEPEIIDGGVDCILPPPATLFGGTARLTDADGGVITESFSVSFSC